MWLKNNSDLEKHLNPLTILLRNILPYDNFTLTARLSPIEVRERLLLITDPFRKPSLLPFDHRQKPYEGVITKSWFEINEIRIGREFQAPIITGEIIPETEFTRIKIKIRIVKEIIIFLGIWLGIVGIIAISTIIGIIKKLMAGQSDLGTGDAVPFVILFVTYLIVFGSYFSTPQNQKNC